MQRDLNNETLNESLISGINPPRTETSSNRIIQDEMNHDYNSDEDDENLIFGNIQYLALLHSRTIDEEIALLDKRIGSKLRAYGILSWIWLLIRSSIMFLVFYSVYNQPLNLGIGIFLNIYGISTGIVAVWAYSKGTIKALSFANDAVKGYFVLWSIEFITGYFYIILPDAVIVLSVGSVIFVAAIILLAEGVELTKLLTKRLNLNFYIPS